MEVGTASASEIAKPAGVVLTLRIIKSFPYGNVKPYVMTGMDLSMTGAQLLEAVKEDIGKVGSLRPVRGPDYDSLKLYHVPFGAKTQNRVINLGDDDKFALKPDVALKDQGVVGEAEISLYVKEDYEAFVKDPTVNW